MLLLNHIHVHVVYQLYIYEDYKCAKQKSGVKKINICIYSELTENSENPSLPLTWIHVYVSTIDGLPHNM